MSFDLIARNKKCKPISFGLIGWMVMLEETGMGYVVGYGKGLCPGTNVYRGNENTGSPMSNDDYYVSADQARAMAMVAKGFASVQRFVNKEWESYPEDQRERMKEATLPSGAPMYRTIWHEDRIKLLDKFADFAERSQGFIIS